MPRALFLLWLLVRFGAVLLNSLLRKRQLKTIAFFHPFADGGGGGEKVLWWAVKITQEALPSATVALFTGGNLSGAQLRQLALERFNVKLGRDPLVVSLRCRDLLQPDRYKVATIAAQALASCLVTLEAVSSFRPDVFVDTTGWAFGYPIARAAGCRVVSYVHYPTVSSEMVARVSRRHIAFNNSAQLARSSALTMAKVAYYRALSHVYALCGRMSHCVMANSTWTARHIDTLWGTPVRVVYPPCDTAELAALDREPGGQSGPGHAIDVISVGQFRPEKDHAKQIEAFAAARRAWTGAGSGRPNPRLFLVGTCRDASDRALLRDLVSRGDSLGLGPETLCVREGLGWEEMKKLMAHSSAGLHTMVDEHFGISVVEYMATGCIPIAHRSGGPLLDTIGPGQGRVSACTGKKGTHEEEAAWDLSGGALETDGESGSNAGAGLERQGGGGANAGVGFLCDTVEEYRDALLAVWNMSPARRREMTLAGRKRAEEFAVDVFVRRWISAISPILASLSST